MTLDRQPQRAMAAIHRRPAGCGTVQRCAAVMPSPAHAFQQRLGNRGTQAFVREHVLLRSACSCDSCVHNGPDDQRPRDGGSGSAGDCVQPTSIAHVKDDPWPPPGGYLTAGGICALMQIEPKGRSGYCPVSEEVTRDDKSTCPATIFSGGGCGGSTGAFPVGAAKGACAGLKPAADQFTDRHTAQVRTSVLHDKERNPKKLDQCTNVCNQVYYTVDGAGKRKDLDRYVITTNLSKASKEQITNVVVEKSHA